MAYNGVLPKILLMPLSLLWLNDSCGTENPDSQEEALGAFEQPLLSELLRKGYSPKNAAVASQHLLSDFVRCWNSDKNTSPNAEPETVVIRLGGETIVTYGSVCLSEFLSNVKTLPQP